MEELKKRLKKLYDEFKVNCILELWDELSDEDRETVLEEIDDPVCANCPGCECIKKAIYWGVHPAEVC